MTIEQKKALAIANARLRGNIDPETGATFDPEIPTKMALNRSAQAQKEYNQANPESTTSKVFDVIGKAWDASKLEGLMPEVAPVSGITRMPFSKVAGNVADAASNVATKNVVAKKLGDLLSKAGDKVSSLPSRFLSFQSGKDPEAFSTIYNIYKEGNPELEKAVSEATPLGKKLFNDMIYNYARKLQLPHEQAILAKDYTKNHPEKLGAWDLLEKHYVGFPQGTPAAEIRSQVSAYKPWASLTDAEKVKQATQAGVDTANWSPRPPKTGQQLSADDLWTVGKKVVLPLLTSNPLLAATASPRVSRLASMLAGKGAKTANKVGQVLPELTMDDLINLGIIESKTKNQGEE